MSVEHRSKAGHAAAFLVVLSRPFRDEVSRTAACDVAVDALPSSHRGYP